MDILSVLQRLGSGHLLDELADALAATTADVVDTGRPGKVTVTLTITTRAQGESMVTVDETVARSVPKRKPRGAIFWAENGDLCRDDPRQQALPGFRTVNTGASEVRDIEDSATEVNVR